MAFHYSPKIVTDGLVFLLDAGNPKSYPGSGTVWTDLAGTGKTGTLTNGPTFSSTKHGSIVFDGSNDYIQTNFTYSLPTITTNFTAGVWVGGISQSGGTAGRVILSNYNGTPIPFNLYVRGSTNTDPGTFQGYSRGDSNSAVSVRSTTRIDDDNWHYCVYTKNDNTYTVYIDGVLETSTSATLGVTTITNNMVLANLNVWFNQGVVANIAQTSVHNRALTATEVLQNYNATKTRFI